MALKEVTLKRVIDTSGNTDELFPSTTMAQVRVSTGDATTLSSYLGNTYIPLSQKGAASGVATLGTDSKVPVSQLPASIIGGLKFQGSVSAADVNTDDEIALLIKGVVDTYGLTAAVGSYWIASNAQTWQAPGGYVTPSTGGSYDYAWSEQDPGEEGGSGADSFTVESGDWVVIQSITQSGTTNDYDVVFAIVNNTYRDASASAKGIVQLSNASDTTGSTNEVITESALASMIGTTANKIAAGDHLHDNRYYQESEIQNFFAGTSSISGYNKTNWDTAYGDKIDSASFATGTGVLTLTRQDSGTVTVDLDGRYVESATFNNFLDGDTAIDGHYFTEIIYGATPSSTNVGTILIDED